MDQFRSSGVGGGGEAKEADGSRAPFSPPSSAFSRPILPASSTLLLPPKPLGGAPNGTTTSSAPAPDPPAESAGRYRECLRNHAASIGGHVVDGCGEFMPAGPAEPMKCAACGCHRSFHRREPEPVGSSGNLVRVPLLLPPPPHPHGPRAFGFGCSGNATTESSSEERNAHHSHSHDAHDAAGSGERGKKKRFRTKFSSEQKEKMTAFAERAEWRVQRKDEAEMERFCREIGVTRQVLKVWMHNNKHLVKKHHHHQQQQAEQEQEQHNQEQQEQEEAIAEKNAVAR